tara:strand:+ start:5744 stop:6388 length:645 start_codon:yes stop_codon:yes gene_type:complete
MKGYYINLDSRKDRKEHFEKNIKKHKIFSNITRSSAIKHTRGDIGCGMSHLNILQKLKNEEGEYFLVCEDDLIILSDNALTKFEEYFEKIKDNKEWDLILLTPFSAVSVNGDAELNENHFVRIVNAQTTTAYIVKKSFIDLLIMNFDIAIKSMEKGGCNQEFAIDMFWKKLQPQCNFYTFKYRFMGQLPGYSDIEKRIVNYNGWVMANPIVLTT